MGKRAGNLPVPAVVIYGDEPFARAAEAQTALDRLLPPDVDRALALSMYDGSQKEDRGGPTAQSVMEDLRTLPFLADRRVVLIRDADAFISACRETLEQYFAHPAPTGVLVLECRSFPATTRLHKAIVAAGGQLIECKKLKGRELVEFVVEVASGLGKRMDAAVAARLVNLIGDQQGSLSAEIEKLALYVDQRAVISDKDVTDLVGLSREEKVFAAMDAAALGEGTRALELWRQALETDNKAIFKAVGGVAYMLRRWITAHHLAAQGLPPAAIAPKVVMWGRDRELATILKRLSLPALRKQLAALADLDAQAKSGSRSIETGVEILLLRLAHAGSARPAAARPAASRPV